MYYITTIYIIIITNTTLYVIHYDLCTKLMYIDPL